MDFSGKVAVVNGADTPFGQAVSLAFAKTGASLGITGANTHKLAETLALLQSIAGTARSHAANIAEATEAEQCVASLAQQLGERIDILVNVHVPDRAGPREPAADQARWASHMTVAAARFLAAPGGRVINVTSFAGLLGSAGDADDAIAAAGLIALSKSLAKDLAPRQITVNCVCVGPRGEDEAGNVPMKRPATAEDVIPAILFLASTVASYVTGLVLSVDGGHSRLP